MEITKVDIDIDKRFLVKCRNCGVLLDDVSSAGGAEEIARNHINEDVAGLGYPYYGHVVEINEYTVVGRGV